MLTTLKDWWPIIVFAGTCVGGGGIAFLVVTRVRVPNIERRLTDLERAMASLAKRLEQGVLVRSDLYDENHTVRFIGRSECGNMRHSCADGVAYDIREVKACVDSQISEARATRTVLMMFMAAVKEKMKLELEIPEVH